MTQSKIAPNAASDLRRVRDMWMTGAALAVGLVVFAVATRSTTREGPGALSRSHVGARVTCDACHAKGEAAASCTGCHDAASHASTRPAHARMRAEGTLGCVDCHPAHGDGQAVALETSGGFVRSGGGDSIAGHLTHGSPAATVPLVPLAACARCHALDSRTDPAAICGRGDPSQRASLCLDEHKSAADSHRFAAWSAASEVVRTTAWVEPKHPDASPWGWLAAGLVSTSAALVFQRRRRARKTTATTLLTPPTVKRLPMIDTTTCLGCHACVDACPFDVIEVERFVAVVARPDECCGVVLCEQACPNGSLQIAEEKTKTPRLVGDNLESVDVPGLFLAGDLTGVPLIKNAIRQGTAVVDHIVQTARKPALASSDVLDVIIVGAGPAGLAASLRAKERSLHYVTLEQATVAASIRAFPRHKLVYDQPLDLPCEGELWLRTCTKEELLTQWTRVVRKHALAIREHHRVSQIERDGSGGTFVVRVQSDGGESVLRARHVVIAIGRRGSPRKLPGFEISPRGEANVFYHLADSRSLAGQRVLVVGLGDSAMEAAIALASQPDTHVTVCHRGEGFSRGKARNVAEVRSLVQRKKIALHFSTEVASFDGATLVFRTPQGSRSEPFDAVFVLVGGAQSFELLERAGVQIVSRAGAYEATTPSSVEAP